MCRLPQGHLSCLFNTCANTLALSLHFGLFVLQRNTCTYTHINVQQGDPLLTPVVSETTCTSSQQISSGRATLIIRSRMKHFLLAAPCRNIFLWYKPITEQSIRALSLFLYSPGGIYCSAWLFMSSWPQTPCPASCSWAVFTIVNRQQIPWRYQRFRDITRIEMSSCSSDRR